MKIIKIHNIIWKSMKINKIHENPWKPQWKSSKSMKKYESQSKIHQILWKSMKFMKIHEILWKSMEIHANQWKCMKIIKIQKMGGPKIKKCEYLLNDAEWSQMDGPYPRRICGPRPEYTITTSRRGRVIR